MASSPVSTNLSVFNQQKLPQDNCQVFTSCICIKRILTLLKYYSLLQINSNRDHQIVFNDFIHKIYNISELIMDQYHLQKKHNHQIYEIMHHASKQYGFPSCDMKTCAHSSRLYRVEDKSSEIKIFDKEDKESILPVYIDII